MSLHRSLKSYPFRNRHRSVRKRYERLRSLMLQEKWDKEHNSVFGLPKEKRLKKKEVKVEKKEEKKESTLTLLSTEKKKVIKKKSRDVGKIK